MNLETVRLFLEVIKTGNITNAAITEYITQSSLSKKMSSLEKELGVKLFERQKGKNYIRLTSAGKDFADIAKRMTVLYNQALELKHERRDFISIGCIRSANSILSKFLNSLSENKFCITVEDHHTSEIISLIDDFKIDLGITHSAPFNLKSHLLYEESYKFVSRKKFFKTSIHPTELSVKNCIYQSFDFEFENWFEKWFKLYSAKIRVNTTPAGEEYFTDEDDWMIVPTVVAESLEKIGYFSYDIDPLADAPIRRVYLLHSKNISSTNYDFVNSFIEFCSEL